MSVQFARSGLGRPQEVGSARFQGYCLALPADFDFCERFGFSQVSLARLGSEILTDLATDQIFQTRYGTHVPATPVTKETDS